MNPSSVCFNNTFKKDGSIGGFQIGFFFKTFSEKKVGEASQLVAGDREVVKGAVG